MRYYYTCDVCGANLDPGERCSDCEERQTIKKTSATLEEAEAQTIQKKLYQNKQVYYNTTRSKCQGLRELFVR